MAYKHSVIIFLFLSISLLKLEAQSNKVYLRGQNLQLYQNNFYVEKVIDARENKKSLGTVYTNSGTSREAVVANGEIAQLIYDLYSHNLPESPERTPVTVKINMLNFDVNGKNDLLEANFDFYTKENEQIYYQFMGGYTTEIVTRRKADKCEMALLEVIGKTFNEFSSLIKYGRGYKAEVSEAELYINTISQSENQAATIHKKKNGIYYSVNDFRDNRPDTYSLITPRNLESRLTERGIRKFDFGEGVLLDHVWGVVYEGQSYYRSGELFVTLFRTEFGLFINYVVTHNKNEKIGAKAAAGFLVAGIAGAGLAALTDAYRVNETLIEIDIFTGRPSIAVDQSLKPLIIEAFEKKDHSILYFYLPQKTDETVELFINDQKVSQLSAYNYFETVVDSATSFLIYTLKSHQNAVSDTIHDLTYNDRCFEIAFSKEGLVSLQEKDGKTAVEKVKRWIEKDFLIKPEDW